MKVKRKKRRTSIYVRAGLAAGLLAITMACFKMDKPSSSSSTPPPSTPANTNIEPGINYDRPGAGTPEQTTGGVPTYKVSSKVAGRDLPYRVILPTEYKDKADARYPVVYLLHGLTGHFSDWIDRTNLLQIAAKYNFIVVTPEGNDGWYSDSAISPNDRYESYIVNELIPEIDKRFRTLADRQHRVIAGLSMGGYGSLKFGLKYPTMFSMIGSFSGALKIAEWSENAGGNKAIGKSIDVVFGPINSPARKANDIFRMARELTPDKAKALPYIYQSCGTEDPMLEGNRAFDKLLTEKGVVHDFKTSKGGHDWVFWGDQVAAFLDMCDRRLKG